MALEIRAGRPDDAGALFAIHRDSAMTAYVEIFPPERYPFPDAEMRAHWASVLDSLDSDVLLAERAGVPVGFASVSPGWLRSGALHDEAIGLLGARGEREAHLWVLELNVRARRFYETRGWRDDGGRSRSKFPPHPLELRYALRL